MLCLSASRGQGDLDLATSWHPLTISLVVIIMVMMMKMLISIMIANVKIHTRLKKEEHGDRGLKRGE